MTKPVELSPETPPSNSQRESKPEVLTLNVYHRWLVSLDSEHTPPLVTFLVSKKYNTDEEALGNIDPGDLAQWDKVLVLPFPASNVSEVDGALQIVAGTPIFFDASQLLKRYIPYTQFFDVVTEAISRIGSQLTEEYNLAQTYKEGGWDLL